MKFLTVFLYLILDFEFSKAESTFDYVILMRETSAAVHGTYSIIILTLFHTDCNTVLFFF